MSWNHFPRCWPFVKEIHRWSVDFPRKGHQYKAFMFSLLLNLINSERARNSGSDSMSWCHSAMGNYLTLYSRPFPPLAGNTCHLYTVTSHERHVVLNHNKLGCLFNNISRPTIKTTKHYWPSVNGCPYWPVDPPLSASNEESDCMSWRLHAMTLRWRHNDHAGVSNHQPRDCLLNRLFRRRSKKTSKLRVTGLCVGNSPGPVNSPHKGPVTRKMFPFDDVIMKNCVTLYNCTATHYWFPPVSQGVHVICKSYSWFIFNLACKKGNKSGQIIWIDILKTW